MIQQQRQQHTPWTPGAPASMLPHSQVALIPASQVPRPGTTPGSGLWDELGGSHSWAGAELGPALGLPSHQSHSKATPGPPPLCPCPARWQLVQALAATQAQCQGHKYPVLLWQPWVWRTALTDRGLSPGTTSAR